MTIRSYNSSAGEVYSHIQSDRDLIHGLAYWADALRVWKDLDDEDYGISPGGIQVPYAEKFAVELFSHELRRKKTLEDLAMMYKRLKKNVAQTGTPSKAFDDILLKMLFLASGRGKVAQVA